MAVGCWLMATTKTARRFTATSRRARLRWRRSPRAGGGSSAVEAGLLEREDYTLVAWYRSLAVLTNATDPVFAKLVLDQVELAGRITGIEIQPIPVRGPDEELDATFATIARGRTGSRTTCPWSSLRSSSWPSISELRRPWASQFQRRFYFALTHCSNEAAMFCCAALVCL